MTRTKEETIRLLAGFIERNLPVKEHEDMTQWIKLCDIHIDPHRGAVALALLVLQQVEISDFAFTREQIEKWWNNGNCTETECPPKMKDMCFRIEGGWELCGYLLNEDLWKKTK